MKKILAFLTLAILAVTGVGCGDDNPTGTDSNQYLEFKSNDKFTYSYKETAPDGSTVENSERTREWQVLEILAEYRGRTGVAMVLDTWKFPDGSVEMVDTLYLHADAQGKVEQYGFINSVLGRIPVVAEAGITVDPQWMWLSDTKSGTSGLTWTSLGTVKKTVTIPGFPTQLSMELDATANHQGMGPATVPAGTYDHAFSTDHSVHMTVTSLDGSVSFLNDSLMVHVIADINGGILHQSADGKSITVNLIGSQDVNGFEMELTSVTRGE